MRPCTAIEALLLLIFGCSQPASSDPVPGGGFVLVRVANDAEPVPTDGIEGIVIDVLPGVKYEAHLVLELGRPAQQTATINGKPFVIDEDHDLCIGAQSYGTLATGDRVTITSEGVFRNGQRLGPLPAR